MDAKERYLGWLRDAHAMEEQVQSLLQYSIRRMDDYPEFQYLLETHARETGSNAEILRGCLMSHQKSSSAVKDAAGKLTAMMQNMSGWFVGDEVMKGVMAIYTVQHMKISAYRILVAAADQFGDDGTKGHCEQILDREEMMAEKIKNLISRLTTEYLRREGSDVAAAQ